MYFTLLSESYPWLRMTKTIWIQYSFSKSFNTSPHTKSHCFQPKPKHIKYYTENALHPTCSIESTLSNIFLPSVFFFHPSLWWSYFSWGHHSMTAVIMAFLANSYLKNLYQFCHESFTDPLRQSQSFPSLCAPCPVFTFIRVPIIFISIYLLTCVSLSIN